jgi:hypothetical protein
MSPPRTSKPRPKEARNAVDQEPHHRAGDHRHRAVGDAPVSGLKIWHALVVLVIGAYLTAFIFGPQITGFLSRIPALFGH